MIPVPQSHIRRTHSEIDLEREKELYQYRDGIMYHRLINGMVRRGQALGHHPSTINRSVMNIMQTQASPITVSDTTTDNNMDSVGSSRAVTTSGSTSTTSRNSDYEDWFFYDQAWEEQGYDNVPLTTRPSRECTGSRPCSLESRFNCQETHSCPTLRMEMERSDSPGGDEHIQDTMFELDL
eukprot:CAMPEP_0201623490 /NCGR_PEP_ID=MMETSP0492-20130828/47963_1 /ASSEMBLY_ACC=CAM_ASM_000837 /TAXON_ID=420259 /ORGANISM="Thalassiosira gravida, Strain GMp14c1" /LENGTH=180 /DNA_ID=CAMNT_0048093139 /DNA_START=209 /DNA_END=751 /DNA_ORIENTATION=+